MEEKAEIKAETTLRSALTIAKLSIEDLQRQCYTVKELHEEISREVRSLRYLGTVFFDYKGNLTSFSSDAASLGLVFKYENEMLANKLKEIITEADFKVEIINTYW